MPLHPMPKAHGLIDISSIIIPPRMRKEDEEFHRHVDEELMPSIAEVGLIQPIILSDDEKTLIAGRCRLKACENLGYTSIAYNTQRDMPESDRLLMEMEENNRRQPMSWQDKVLAIATIYEQKKREKLNSAEAWGQKQAGALLGVSSGYIADAMKLASLIKQGVEHIITAKTLKEAIARSYEKTEDSFMAELSRRGTLATPSSPIKKRTISAGPLLDLSFPGLTAPNPSSSLDSLLQPSSLSTIETQAKAEFTVPTVELSSAIHNMDCREFFKECEREVFDCVFTDIPYGIDPEKMLDGIEGVERVAEEHEVEYNLELMEPFIKGSYKVLKENGWLLFFYDISHHEKLLQYAQDAGFKCQGYPLHWIKTHPCRNKSPQSKWTKAVEYVFVARKGTPTFKDTKYTPNYYMCEGLTEKRLQANPFAKPFEFVAWILDRFAIPGLSVLDPFAGDGSILRAAVRKGLVPYGVELNPKCYHRLEEGLKEVYKEVTGGKVQFK